MLKDRLIKLLSLNSVSRLIIFDKEHITMSSGLLRLLRDRGFTTFEYNNIEGFRIVYEENIKSSASKIAVLVLGDLYVPYDIRQGFKEVELTAATIFPYLHSDTVMKYERDWDSISYAYDGVYSDLSQQKQTEIFVMDSAFSYELLDGYCIEKNIDLREMCEKAKSYSDWIEVAKAKAATLYYAAMKNIHIDDSFADDAFGAFITFSYGQLSLEMNSTSPPIVTKILSYMVSERNEKSALIVMDGMSLFDFEVISRHFGNIEYEYSATFAIIPTLTPLSRQSLLSGKYPRELSKPFSLADEEKEFRAKVTSLGFGSNQIEYLRGYDVNIRPLTKFVAIIINEVDDIVHGQQQSRTGMFGDMDLLGRSGKLQALIKRLAGLGFAVYITSDHGNTPCVGVGGFRSGVELESRSMRMAVLKDFAETNALLTENTIEFPGTYLNKSFRYFICKNGVSFDNKGKNVMTHGGISIDEVVVPFIKVKEVW